MRDRTQHGRGGREGDGRVRVNFQLSSNTETLITTRTTGPAALVGLLPAADDAFRRRRRCPRRWYSSMDPPTTSASHASGLSNSLALTFLLVHMLATFTLVALASLPPLLYLIPATVLFLDTPYD
jgi:hypothetical protein